jgi:hypothetical protein
VTGIFAVAGDSCLAEPPHRSHHPSEWSYCRNRGTSPCPDGDRGCVDRRWLACRDRHVKWHGPLPRAYVKGTGHRSQHALEIEVENLGAHLNAYTSREKTIYYAKSFRKDVPQAVDIICDILQTPSSRAAALSANMMSSYVSNRRLCFDKQHEVVFDHLHAVAYQGMPPPSKSHPETPFMTTVAQVNLSVAPFLAQ